MINATIIITAALLGAYLAFSRRLSQSSSWQAIVTPLASIMGSGFLVSAPLLAGVVGNLAVICMAVLLVLAFAIGEAIRFNIKHFEPIENEQGLAQTIAFLSRIVLAAAYFISVTYYLQLLAAFVLNAFHIDNQLVAHCITTALLVIISGIGMWKGLEMLEGVEKYAVAMNLGMIGALLVALGIYNANLLIGGQWKLPDISSVIDLKDARVLLGLLIVVQGFETSRYMGNEHPAEQRISTMRTAQLIAAMIYVVFIGLTTVLFHEGLGSDVTAIIAMTAPVATILPILLSAAAIGSQFSASVADTEGCGGLVGVITHHKLPTRFSYLLILLVTVFITWETNVNEIIAYASRAFALYYMLQCAVALVIVWQVTSIPKRVARIFMFSMLSAVCLLVFALGIPSG
ncbi:hypothetical protein [Mariniblastus fucicola]|uniref:Uncharacterized protein n=1 Tax=Mariniblastus fucicola TaxID=980251 RepID=A0A5B9P977_9BACT|nr:hypothetical protein [Mariniblastus fucicola]QEG22914.1 hypothetical protein MFFC18_28020 [Mariniblastus fucicola]